MSEMERLQRMFARVGGALGHPPPDSPTLDSSQQVYIFAGSAEDAETQYRESRGSNGGYGSDAGRVRPTDIRHVAHVTFDKFNGFFGLPNEFELEVPR